MEEGSIVIQPRYTSEGPAHKVENAWSSCSPSVARLLKKALDGNDLTEAEGVALLTVGPDDLPALLAVADELRRRAVGDNVTFVVTRNINFTNVCYMGCRFCAFSRRMEDADAEMLPMEEIARRAQEAWDRGATEVCIQGGLHPKIRGSHYRDILTAIKRQVPDIHIHAFSPFEIWYGARLSRQTPAAFLADLRDHGLGSIPGTAAEILDTEIRRQLTRDKLTAAQWVDIIRAAHGVGLKSTATMMYGHIDEPRHWAAHMVLLRELQKETGGFTEFVPLGFVHHDSPLYLEGGARPGPTRDEHLRVHAVARLLLNAWIPNLQVSWVKMGPALAGEMLSNGVNDLGGTLMNESISRAAGAAYGQEVTPSEMVSIIRGVGKRPVRRGTLYQHLEAYDTHAPAAIEPLVPRATAKHFERNPKKKEMEPC